MTQAMEHYKKALELFGRNEHVDAIGEYEKALAMEPDWTEALHGLAMAQMQAGRLEDAIKTGERVVELDPDDPFAYTSLSMFWQRKGDIDEAERQQAKARMAAWKQELKENPDAPPPTAPGSMNVVQ